MVKDGDPDTIYSGFSRLNVQMNVFQKTKLFRLYGGGSYYCFKTDKPITIWQAKVFLKDTGVATPQVELLSGLLASALHQLNYERGMSRELDQYYYVYWRNGIGDEWKKTAALTTGAAAARRNQLVNCGIEVAPFQDDVFNAPL